MFWYVCMVCWMDWKLICRNFTFLYIWKWINVFHLLRRTRTSLSFTWWYTQPLAPHATPTAGKPQWQDSPVASPQDVGLRLEGFFFIWNTWNTIRRTFLQLEYLALTNAASRSVAERKAGECLTSTSCCIQSTPPSLWTGQYSLVFCSWNATVSYHIAVLYFFVIWVWKST